MAESNSKLPAPLQQFVTDLKEKLIKTEASIRELRAREASTRTQKLEKHELCALCGGPERDALCPCITKLQKNAVQGYAQSTPGSGLPSNTGMGSMGGGGTQPMGLSEKDPGKTCAGCGEKIASDSPGNRTMIGGKPVCESCMKAGKGMKGGPPLKKGESAHDKFVEAKALKKAALCKTCGYEHDEMAEHVKGRKLNKGEALKKDYAGLSDVGQLSKVAPPGEEKLVHKLKDEYGHDEEGKRKAFATAWAIKNKTVKKDEINATPHLDDAKSGKGLAKMGMPSSSAAALAPAAPKPATPIAHANQELGGFKSLATSPTAMPSPAGPSLTPGAGRKSIGSMGRASASAAGMIPNAKAELNPGSASKYGTGGPGHATQTNMPSALKANMAVTKAEMSKPYAAKVGITDHRNKAKAAYGDGPHDQRPAMHQAVMGQMNSASPAPPPVKTAKGEEDMVYPKTVAAPDGPDTKMPKAGKKADAKKTGSGGQIKGNPLKKAAPAEAAKPVVGVPGKQPVGQGGGDAFKAPGGGGGKLPGPGAAAPRKIPGHAAALAAKAGPKPAAGPSALRRAGSAEVGRMIGDKGAAAPAAAPASVDVDVSEFDKGPNRFSPAHTSTAAAPGNPGALQAVRDKLNLAADKKAGGVGFLRGLMAMFQRPTKVNPAVEAAAAKLGGNRGTTIPTDSTGGVQTLPPGTPTGPVKSKRFHGALPLRRAELSLSELESDHKAMLDKGLAAANHNRRMLSVSTKRHVVKKSR